MREQRKKKGGGGRKKVSSTLQYSLAGSVNNSYVVLVFSNGDVICTNHYVESST